MAYPTRTYVFANSTTADATQVNQNNTDWENGFSDGTKDLNMNQGTFAGKLTASAAVVTSGVSTVVAANGGSSTVADTTAVVILAPAATIASYTLTLPASPSEGHRLTICTNAEEITALTVSANTGHTIATGAVPTKFTAGMSVELVFRSTVWYRAASGAPRHPTVQRFTSGSGTYTTPTGVSWIRVRMVGGGGGGASIGAGTNGSAGGDTTFGTALLTAGGGGGGNTPANGYLGGAGGTTTVNSPAITSLAAAGMDGGSGQNNGALSIGGSSFLGSVVLSDIDNAGISGLANTGAGGTSSVSSAGSTGGAGGGGGYVDAIITSPSASYSYSVGAGGAKGVVATYSGGDGGSGIIIVEEFYT